MNTILWKYIKNYVVSYSLLNRFKTLMSGTNLLRENKEKMKTIDLLT